MQLYLPASIVVQELQDYFNDGRAETRLAWLERAVGGAIYLLVGSGEDMNGCHEFHVSLYYVIVPVFESGYLAF